MGCGWSAITKSSTDGVSGGCADLLLGADAENCFKKAQVGSGPVAPCHPGKDTASVHHRDRGLRFLLACYRQRLAEPSVQPLMGCLADGYENALAKTINRLLQGRCHPPPYSVVHLRSRPSGRKTNRKQPVAKQARFSRVALVFVSRPRFLGTLASKSTAYPMSLLTGSTGKCVYSTNARAWATTAFRIRSWVPMALRPSGMPIPSRS